MRLRYVSMLLGFTPIIAAISLLLRPSSTSFSTCSSRALSALSAFALPLFFTANDSGPRRRCLS
jgi:hypothetical protein